LSRESRCCDVREISDLLLPAILKDLKIFGSKICDLLSALVGYGSVYLNKVCSDANDVFIAGRWLLYLGGGWRRSRLLRLLLPQSQETTPRNCREHVQQTALHLNVSFKQTVALRGQSNSPHEIDEARV